MADKDYLTTAETAGYVRRALAREFPGVRFWVRSKVYSGGSSINVHYDGSSGAYAPLTACYCVTGPTPGATDPFRCTVCDYMGRPQLIYREGMPTADAVKAVASAFEGRDFDGMIDGSVFVNAYVTPDGRVLGHVSPGSGGSLAPRNDPQPLGTRLVHFGASYVFVEPTLPYDVRSRAAAGGAG